MKPLMLLLELNSMSNDKFLTGSMKLIKSSWKNLLPHKNPSSTSSIPWLCREKVPVLLLLSPITGICNLTPRLLLFGPSKRPEKQNSPKIPSNAWSQSMPWLVLMEIPSSKMIFDFSFCFHLDFINFIIFISFLQFYLFNFKNIHNHIEWMVEFLWECQILVDTFEVYQISYRLSTVSFLNFFFFSGFLGVLALWI